MMRPLAIGLLSLVLALSWSCSVTAQPPPASPQGQQEYKALLQTIDEQIAWLSNYLEVYPPAITDEQERQEVEKRLTDTLAYIEKANKENPGNGELLWRLGNCYRLAHNLDRAGAWKKSEKALKAALRIDQKLADSHFILGLLYVNTHPQYAPAAEKEFLAAQRLAGNKPWPAIHGGLCFAYYYQERFDDALRQADKYLKLVPDDSAMKRLREIIREKIKNQEP
jgi:tetratricopeptide (TPR) repeat protein